MPYEPTVAFLNATVFAGNVVFSCVDLSRMKRIIKNSSKVRNHRFLVFFNQRAGFRFETMDRKTLPEDFIVEDDDAADMTYIEKLLRKPFKLSMSKTISLNILK